MVFCMVHIFLPEVVEISVEIAVNLFVVVFARFTNVFFTGNIHFQYSLWTVTVEFQIFTRLCARLFLAEIRLVDLSGSNFHGHGFDGNPNFHRLRELFTGMFLAIH